MLDPDEWEWLEEHAEGDFDHLLIGTSLPLLLAPGAALPGVLERGGLQRRVGQAGRACSARRCARRSTSSTGRRSASSLDRVMELVRDVGAAGKAPPPASIVALSGDVHHAYLAEVGVPARDGRALGRLPGDLLAVPQPARRPRAAHDPLRVRRAAGTLVGKLLARAAGVGDRRCAGASCTTSRSSTTRSASSSSTGGARGCGCRRRSPRRTRATRWRRSSSASSASDRQPAAT